jgi:hypothetical protein
MDPVRLSTRILWAAVLIPFVSTGCDPGVRPAEEVWLLPKSLPVEDFRTNLNLRIAVRAELGQPVVEAAVSLPDEVTPWMRGVHPDTPMRTLGNDLRRPSWSGGELAPGTLGIFPIWFSFRRAEVGDTLVFPVELVLKDGSVVEWGGPPGSDRPAPRLVVRQGRRFGGRTSLMIVTLALVPLFAAGVWKVSQRMRYRGSIP